MQIAIQTVRYFSQRPKDNSFFKCVFFCFQIIPLLLVTAHLLHNFFLQNADKLRG